MIRPETLRIWKIDSNGDIVTIVGARIQVRGGDVGPGHEPDIDAWGIRVDSEGNLFLDVGWRERKIDVSGATSPIAGSARILPDGDCGPPMGEHLIPRSVATSRAGDIRFADHLSDRGRALRPSPLLQVGEAG